MNEINENKILEKWSTSYKTHVKRNIGLLRISEQEMLRKTPIAILGTGGLGGPLVEQLVRSGCEHILICDNDKYEESNLNRQLCTRDDLGKYKVDTIENFLIKINPEINLNKYYEINESNISNMLNKISIVALTLDDPITSILIARECLKMNIPMLESWGIPYLCAWWFSSDSIDYETCYGFNTQEQEINDLRNSDKIFLNIRKAMISKLTNFPRLHKTYNRVPGVLEKMILGDYHLVSLAPIVRLTASYLAFEIIFSGVLKIKQMVMAPKIIGYDYISMEPINFSF